MKKPKPNPSKFKKCKKCRTETVLAKCPGCGEWI